MSIVDTTELARDGNRIGLESVRAHSDSGVLLALAESHDERSHAPGRDHERKSSCGSTASSASRDARVRSGARSVQPTTSAFMRAIAAV
jgi:hypothetical protein